VIRLPKENYTPKQDVQLGKEAASEVRKQYPIIEHQHIAKYFTQIGKEGKVVHRSAKRVGGRLPASNELRLNRPTPSLYSLVRRRCPR
jgi:hypothetical protein